MCVIDMYGCETDMLGSVRVMAGMMEEGVPINGNKIRQEVPVPELTREEKERKS